MGLAAQIQNREQQVFALSGLLVFADKIMDRETAKRIRRAIEMTQVAMIFEEEKQDALQEAAKRFEKERQEAAKRFEKEKQEAARKFEKEKQEAIRRRTEQIVVKMLKRGDAAEEIVSIVSNYSLEDVEAVREKLEKEENDM